MNPGKDFIKWAEVEYDLKNNCNKYDLLRESFVHQINSVFKTMITSVNKLITILNDRAYDYKAIYDHPNTIKSLSNEERDINFIIGVKGMIPFFKVVLTNVIVALSKSVINKYRVKIVIVEQDDKPQYKDFCIDNKVEYIFIPQEVCETEGMHSTALMYNIGYLFTKKPMYSIFHCADILVPHNFFDILSRSYITKNPKWLQCFTKTRVKLVSPKASEGMVQDGGKFNSAELQDGRDLLPDPCPGAPGGSILVKSDVFESVGGYDPELFYGYTLEDAFFWTKLECMVHEVNKIESCHCGGGKYADNPPIEIYHLQNFYNPPSSEERNKRYEEHEELWHLFANLDHLDKMKYINAKTKIFKKQKEDLNLC